MLYPQPSSTSVHGFGGIFFNDLVWINQIIPPHLPTQLPTVFVVNEMK